jgi:signal transduction histidine kinase/DNA-binding NarL/FixJ family response regulator
VRLEAAQRRFEITYVGVSLRDPEGVTYRYRLEGFDDGWIEAGAARRAVYTNVTAGMHTFHVQARSFGGVWSDVDDTLTLHVAQFFYKTWWFNLLLGFGLLGLGALLYRRRVRTLESRQRYLHALVDERTKALVSEKETVAAQADQLRSLDRTKSRFFANVSHEFRTPLTLILGPLEDLQDGRLGPLDDGIRRHVGTAIRNGRRMLHLVNQLLDVSRLESGWQELKARECDLGEYVERSLQAFASLAERKRIELRFERPLEAVLVYVDVEQFEKVLVNLVGNALKFTPEGGSVLVSLGLEPADSDDQCWARLRVSDNGPGIPSDHLPHVFERFYQVDASSTRRQPGTGIGLALVKSLVDLHHGRVSVESNVGLGTTFTVRLRLGATHLRPVELADSASDIAGPSPVLDEILIDVEDPEMPGLPAETISSDDNLTTLLVVDDNPEIRQYIRGHLAPRYRVVEAADGREALRQARAFTPDLVLTDIMMPDMNGYDLCRAIRRDPDLAFIPIILLTARESIENRLIGLEEGADDYVSKPFNVRELEIRIENLIASRQRLKASFLVAGAAAVAGSSGGAGASEDGSSVRSATAPSKHPSFVGRVREVIAAKLSEDDFDVDALAAALGVGRSNLYTRLSQDLATSPMDLIWRMRLERAAPMLRIADSSVSEVAYGVGFKSVGHFCRRFRMEFGCSPTEYTTGLPDAAD